MCVNISNSNCWKTPKLYTPQRKIETSRRDGYESKKKCVDSVRLKPKHKATGNQQQSSK